MTFMRRIAILIMIAALSSSPAAFAGGEHGGKEHGGKEHGGMGMREVHTEGWASNASGKLGRGLFNILTSPAEVTCNIYYDAEHHPWTAAFTGVAKGVFFMATRIVVGAAEVITFPFPSKPWIHPVCNGPSWNWYPKKPEMEKMMAK